MRNGIANPVNEARLRGAITAQLAAVGVQPANGAYRSRLPGRLRNRGANPDRRCLPCRLGLGLRVRPRWGWRGGGYYGGYAGWDEPYVYREGIVAVDLYDARTKQPIWHASVNQSLYGASVRKPSRKSTRPSPCCLRNTRTHSCGERRRWRRKPGGRARALTARIPGDST